MNENTLKRKTSTNNVNLGKGRHGGDIGPQHTPPLDFAKIVKIFTKSKTHMSVKNNKLNNSKNFQNKTNNNF